MFVAWALHYSNYSTEYLFVRLVRVLGFELLHCLLAGFIRYYLLRDVYDDMILDGVQPIRDTFHSLSIGAMKQSKLQDAFFFRDEMKTMGISSDVLPSFDILSLKNFFLLLFGDFFLL